MQGPKISILIPTRERAPTLGPCLETCVAQEYANLEILVSDNASGPDTRDVVAKFTDARIRYFRQDARISMRQNFEFLIGRATGDYVIMIGDDDGIMPGAISAIADFLSRDPVDVLNWTSIVYDWPGRRVPGEGILNCKYQKMFGGLTRVDPRQRLGELARGERLTYLDGSNIYHGCVGRRVIERVRSATGRVFSDHLPDVYACVAFLFAAETMAHINHPLSISGVSLASHGYSFFADRDGAKINAAPTPAQSFAAEANNDPDLELPYNSHLRAAQYYSARGLLIANRHFGGDLKINIDAWARVIVAEGGRHCDLAVVAKSLGDDFELDRAIKAVIAGLPRIPAIAPSAGATPAAGLKEKFNRIFVRCRIGDRDDVFTAYQTLDRLLQRPRVARRGMARRLFDWLSLRERRGRVDLAREAA